MRRRYGFFSTYGSSLNSIFYTDHLLSCCDFSRNIVDRCQLVSGVFNIATPRRPFGTLRVSSDPKHRQLVTVSTWRQSSRATLLKMASTAATTAPGLQLACTFDMKHRIWFEVMLYYGSMAEICSSVYPS